jgi:hypothetical protein
MSSIRFNACLNTTYHGLLHPFEDARVVVDSLIGIHDVMVKYPLIVKRSSIHKGT